MTPIAPKIARVDPRCIRCSGRSGLIRGDGPVVCRSCVHMGVRLAGASRPRDEDTETRRLRAQEHDTNAREGWR